MHRPIEWYIKRELKKYDFSSEERSVIRRYILWLNTPPSKSERHPRIAENLRETGQQIYEVYLGSKGALAPRSYRGHGQDPDVFVGDTHMHGLGDITRRERE
ncbi:MAG: hypothetical protein HYT70_02805 [Candidatus Aenigmarchaeota archaeon]|nr:hypothetical protein [Candidatus Aenigmarchaeota archaeon]